MQDYTVKVVDNKAILKIEDKIYTIDRENLEKLHISIEDALILLDILLINRQDIKHS